MQGRFYNHSNVSCLSGFRVMSNVHCCIIMLSAHQRWLNKRTLINVIIRERLDRGLRLVLLPLYRR